MWFWEGKKVVWDGGASLCLCSQLVLHSLDELISKTSPLMIVIWSTENYDKIMDATKKIMALNYYPNVLLHKYK